MAAVIELETIKQQLNIDLDYESEDLYLLTLADVAVKAIENHIDHPIDDYIVDGQLDSALQQAALMLIATWYQNRESVAYGAPMKLPHGVDYLLESYIDYAHKCNCCS